MLVSGCGAKKTENTDAAGIPAVVSSSQTEEKSVPELRYGLLKKLSEQVGKAVSGGNWEELSSLFSDGKRKEYSADALKKAFAEVSGETVRFEEGCPVAGEDVSGGIALLAGEAGTYEAAFVCDDNYALTSLSFAKRNMEVNTESTDEYEETEITAGNAPKIHGILTLPREVSDAPVAVLIPEEIDDPMNESGSNADFRKDLAHGLAENGIASVRFDLRCYEDPLVSSVFGIDFARMIGQDFAAVVHSLEQYPVNAAKIIYVGHGVGGTLGYAAVSHHFELDGGLVLLNSPYTEDGVHLFQRSAWLEEEAAEEALKLLGEEETDYSAEAAGYPLSWWKKWQSLGALYYTRQVAIPILILQAEDDGMIYFKKDYESWKSQKGSNVTMKSIPKLGHDLKNAEGKFEPTVAEDIAVWMRGEDINKKKTGTGGKS